MKFKALSLQQPYANWVAEGKKTIETRTWRTNYRGPLLIVSSKKPAINPAGYALALVDVTDCRTMTTDDEEAACVGLYPNAKAWILTNLRRIKPLPIQGSLGLYTVEIDDLEYL